MALCLSPLRGSVAAQLAEAPDQLVAGGLSSGAASKIRKARETQKSLASGGFTSDSGQIL